MKSSGVGEIDGLDDLREGPFQARTFLRALPVVALEEDAELKLTPDGQLVGEDCGVGFVDASDVANDLKPFSLGHDRVDAF